MAIISNINDLFSVDSTGAIEFNEQVGTSGYSLESRGAGAPPVWTDRDTGKVTGSGTLNKVARWTATGSDIGDGPITFSGATTTANSTFGGNIALTSPKFIAWNGGSTTSMTIGRNYINFTVPAGESSIYGDTDSSLIMSTENGGDSLLIDIDGNVGIAPNTATGLPAYKLDVGGTIRSGNVIALDAEFTNEVTIKQTSASAGFSGKLFIEGTDVPKIQLKNLDTQTSIDQILGTLEFYGSDASTGNAAGVRASITANTGFVSGGTTARDQGCLEFATYNGSDVSGAPRQHLKITPDGGFSFGLTSTAYGTSGQVLTSAGDAPPTWTTPTTGTVKGTGTATRVAFWSASDTITSDADLYWDNTNKRLGIGKSPSAKLEVSGDTGGGDSIVRFQNTNSTAKSTRIQLLDSAGTVGDALIAYDHSNTNALLHYLGMGVNNTTTLVINNSDNVGIKTASPFSRLQSGGHTFSGGNGMAADSRVGISNHGLLTGMMLASTYNDPTYPEYGLVFVQGPDTSNYNVWSISPDCPAKGDSLNFIYGSNATNIHVTSPKVVFDGNGNVGIGVTSPGAKFQVGATISAAGTGISVNAGAGGGNIISVGTTNHNWFPFTNGQNYYSSDVHNFRSASNTVTYMVLNSTSLTASGDIVAYGSPSDKRLKENIKPIKSALDKVSKLQGVTFNWKKSDSILDIKEDIGFIAQDVQKVVPELVRENENGMLSMRHQGIAPILLEAIKELKAEIEELKSNKCNCNK